MLSLKDSNTVFINFGIIYHTVWCKGVLEPEDAGQNSVIYSQLYQKLSIYFFP